MKKYIPAFLLPILLLPAQAWAASADVPDFTQHWAGYAAVALFVLAYIFVMIEETIHLKKSKPVMVAAGLIWMLVAFAYTQVGRTDAAAILRHNFLEYAELSMFLFAAMTYINTMEERNLFQVLRSKLVASGLSLRALYWVTGLLAFFMSPIADNLTTALVLGAVALAVGAGHTTFISVACINIVVAANSGGAFSPFGDITTLMVWQKGHIDFFEFFALFLPSLVSWIIPAVLMSFAVPAHTKPAVSKGEVQVKHGGLAIAGLFVLTVALTVAMHHLLHLPPFLGMMSGLGALTIYSYFIRHDELKGWVKVDSDHMTPEYKPARKPFDIFVSVKRVEWDTLLFFYGIILCVGGLGAMGYLVGISQFFYQDLGATTANILIGILSAIVDNIPVMFAVLSMNPEMGHAQWLLATLTAGTGGSMLSIGSAAGVALMGQARGAYTFMSHLKWSWAIALGYAAAVWLHYVMYIK